MPEAKKKTIGILAIAGVEPYQEKPGEEYMSPAQVEHFTKILTAWRDQLRAEVRSYRSPHAGRSSKLPRSS